MDHASRRPLNAFQRGQQSRLSATLNFKGSNLFHVFTTSVAGIPHDQSYSKWRFYLYANDFGNDQVRAAKAYLPADVVAEHERRSREEWKARQKAVAVTSLEVHQFVEGERVRLRDRGNIGTVEADDGGRTVTVQIVGKDGVCTKEFQRTEVEPLERSVEGNCEKPCLVFHDAWEASFKPRPMRECIIEGLLRRGETGNAIASTKTGKSWFALMLLLCVATGRDWLGRRVARGNVLLIDNELHEETIENRIAQVRERMNIRHDTPRDRFEYVACRGDFISIENLIAEIPVHHPPGSLNLIVLDAKYRFFGDGLEENSNDDQTKFHNMIDKFAKLMDCPIVLIHHATKGDQSGKSVTDIGSGGGSQSRAVDLHMTIRPHQQPGFAVLEAAVRSFAPVDPVTLRWNWPVWSVHSDVAPALPKKSKDGDRTSEMQSRMLKHLKHEWQSITRLAERCATKKDRPPFADIFDALLQAGTIELTEDYLPPRSKTATTGVRLTSDKSTSDNCPTSLSNSPGLTSDTTTSATTLKGLSAVVGSRTEDN